MKPALRAPRNKSDSTRTSDQAAELLRLHRVQAGKLIYEVIIDKITNARQSGLSLVASTFVRQKALAPCEPGTKQSNGKGSVAMWNPFMQRPSSSAEWMMWVTGGRVFYAGLLGEPAMHARGALAIYVALKGRLRVRMQTGVWQAGEIVVVQPSVRYEITSEERHVLHLMVEPETVDPLQLPQALLGCGVVDAPEFAARVRGAHRLLASAAWEASERTPDFDQMFFGQPLPTRTLDPRIATVLERVRTDPSAMDVAKVCAAQANLSLSRFLHLFKQEVGASFRSVRTWKRARNLLHHVRRDCNLAHVALDLGYPDSTHFSHSIRQNYGLKPSDIVSGSRSLRFIALPSAATPSWKSPHALARAASVAG